MADTTAVKFTADTSQLESALQGVLTRIKALEDGAKSGGEGLKNLGQAGKQGGEEAESALTRLTEALKGVGSHTRTVSIGLEQLGLDAGAGAAKIAGLVEVLENLGGAVPALLAVGAAVTTVALAFDVMKDAVGEAGKLQQSMTLLGQTVRNQGGDWNQLSKSVMEWADAQEKTTTFSRNEAISALTQLTATGMSAADAMKVTRVAEDAAAATGQSLATVEHGLMEAMHGRTQALTALGIGTKQSIHDGMAFNDVLGAIEQHMGGAAEAAANTFPGALTQLHNAWESLMEDVGTPFLNMLTNVAHSITAFVEHLSKSWEQAQESTHQFYLRNKQFIDALGVVWNGLVTILRLDLDEILGQIHAAWDILAGLFTMLGDVLTGHWERIWGDIKTIASNVWHDITGAFGNFGDNMLTIAKAIVGNLKTVFAGLGTAMADAMSGNFAGAAVDIANTGLQVMNGVHLKPWIGGDAMAGVLGSGGGGTTSNPADTHTSINTMVGGGHGGHKGHKKGGSATPYHASETSIKPDDLNALTAAHNALAKASDSVTAAQNAARETIDNTMTEVGFQTAAMDKLHNAYTKALATLPMLKDEMAREEAAVSASSDAVKKKYTAYETATQKLNAYKESLNGKTKLTVAEKEEIKKLTDAQHQADQAYLNADKTLKEQTATLTKHTAQVAADKKAIDAFITSQDKMIASFNQHRIDQDQQIADDKATYGMSLDLQRSYFQQKYDEAKAAEDLFYQQHGYHLQNLLNDEQKYGDKVVAIDRETYNKAIDALKKSTADQETLIQGFLDDVIVKHKSFADILKSIWDKIVQDMIAAVAKMVVEGGILKSLFGNIVGGGGGGLLSLLGLGGAALPAGTAANGIGGSVIDYGAVAMNVPMSAVLPNGTVVELGTNSVKALTGSPMGVSGLGSNITSAMTTSGGGLTFLGILGAAGLGIGGGALGASLTGGNKTDGMLGGLAGVALAPAITAALMGGGGLGIGGLIAAGPVGWGILAAGALAGGAIGGMFGPHLNAQNAPDIYDTANYGQAMADMGDAGLNGNPVYTANGQQFTENSALAQQLGGKGEISYIADYIKSNPAAAAKLLTPDQLREFTNATAMDYKAGGMVDTGNGQLTHWDTLFNNANDALKQIQANTSATAANTTPIYQLTRMGPDFNQARLSQWTPGTIGATVAAAATPGVAPTPPPIVITGNHFYGTGGVDELAQQISEAQARNGYFRRFNRSTLVD